MLDKLEKVVLRYTQVEQQLGDPSVYADLDKLTKLSREQKELQPIVEVYHDYRRAMQNYDEALAMMNDEELRDLAQEELQNASRVVEGRVHIPVALGAGGAAKRQGGEGALVGGTEALAAAAGSQR